MEKKIYVTKSYLPPKEEYFEYLDGIWESRILTNMGPYHRTFEEMLSTYLNVPCAMVTANGHLALELLLNSIDLKGEVITTPFTFASTTHAIVRNGLTPVFCDIKKTDYTIDPQKIENCITDKTSAILGVHVFGNPCDVYEIQKIAKKYNLKVIYDAAHAFGEKIDHIGIGNFGDESIFSFHATKVFHAVEGGCICVKDLDMGYKIHKLRNFGIVGEDKISSVGLNAKMSEMHAAMGLCNLRHIDEIIEARKERIYLYESLLSNVPQIIMNQRKENVDYNYAYMPILFDDDTQGNMRKRVCCALNKEYIYPRKYFYPLTSDCEEYQKLFHINETPVAKWVSENILCLPLYHDLEFDDIKKICSIIQDNI